MKFNTLLKAAGALMLAGSLLPAQKKQPQLKSQKEQEGLMAIFNATDADSRIKATDDFLVKFADTEFKGVVLALATEAAAQKNDFEKLMIYGERAVEADKENYIAMLLMANGLAQRTREFDLDKEEKLGRAEKYARTAIDLVKAAEKPNPQVTDEQWAAAKRDYEAQAHEALGIAAMVRKKWDVASQELKASSELVPSSTVLVRLASVYNESGKPDDAIATLDKINAMPDVHPTVKQVAQNERNKAIKLKAGSGAKPAATTPAAPVAPAPAPPKP